MYFHNLLFSFLVLFSFSTVVLADVPVNKPINPAIISYLLDSTDEPVPPTPSFDDLHLQVGNYYDYEFLITSTLNGSAEPSESGVMRMELTSSSDQDLGDTIGIVTFYRTEFSGDEPWGMIPNCYYIASHNGIIYSVVNINESLVIVILFDPDTGYIYPSGFMGYFSSTREEFVFNGRIENDFINAEAIVVSEPYYLPDCSQVDGVQPCGYEESHSYIVKEYYISGIGFGGFYRSGGSVYTSGGITDTITSNFQLGLIDTNAFDMSLLP